MGLDLAKNVFRVQSVNAGGNGSAQAARRAQVLASRRLPRCLVGMEACATAPLLGRRELRALAMRLVNTSTMREGLRQEQDDAADAAAIINPQVMQSATGRARRLGQNIEHGPAGLSTYAEVEW